MFFYGGRKVDARGDNVNLIAYCLEEYKFAKGIAGKEVIALFKKHDIIDYIVTYYGALRTVSGLAIVEDIDSLIEGMNRRRKTEV